MNREKAITEWLNKLVELEIQEKPVRRRYIISNPEMGIAAVIRYRAESILGLGSIEDRFPQWLRSMVLQFAADKLLETGDLRSIIPGYNEIEMEEGSLFPQLFAAFAADWLCRDDRWKTKKFRRVIVKISK